MKKTIIIIAVVTLLASCKKEKHNPVITGVVQQQGGCLPNTWLVFIPGGDADKYSFLCKSSVSTSSFNCSNAVYIVNMPASLAQFGKRIKFSKWTDSGLPLCSSSTYAPHQLEVSDVSEE